jgi:hypothetical protein
MGAVATTGAGPYSHAITAAAQLPYATIYNAFDSTALVSQMSDCRIPSLTFSGGGGQALAYTAAVSGLIGLEGETDPVKAVSTFDPLVYPHVTVTYDGATTDIVEAFTVNSERSVTVVKGDTGISASAVETGRWGVTGTLRVLFETDAIWRDYLTGSTSGTTHSTDLTNVALNIIATRAAADEVQFDFDAVDITKVSLVPDPSGNPIFYDIEWAAKPDTTAIGNTLTITAKNSTASLTA